MYNTFHNNSNLLHENSTSSQVEYYCLIPDNVFCRYNSIDPLQISFKSYIRDENLTIEQLALKASLSKFYFLREFKKLTGDTSVAFINKARCENAKKLLTLGSYSVSDVCEKCGFENMSYFAKVFKNYTGITPKDFRKTVAKQYLI